MADRNEEQKRRLRNLLKKIEVKRNRISFYQVEGELVDEKKATRYLKKKYGIKIRSERNANNDTRTDRTSRHTKAFDPAIAVHLQKTFEYSNVFIDRQAIAKLGGSDQEKREYLKHKLTTGTKDTTAIHGGKGGMFQVFEGAFFDESNKLQFQGNHESVGGVTQLTFNELPKAIEFTVRALPNQVLNFTTYVSKMAHTIFRRSFYDGGFDGKRWAALSARTIKKRKARGTWKGHGRKILMETGSLMNALESSEGSFTSHDHSMAQATVGVNERKISSSKNPYNPRNINYAAVHMAGNSHPPIPARPFMGHSRTIATESMRYARACFVYGALW